MTADVHSTWLRRFDEIPRCVRSHPGWNGDLRASIFSAIGRTWKVGVGYSVHTHRVDHEQMAQAEPVSLPTGTVVCYLGSCYRGDVVPHEVGYHVFQVLELASHVSRVWPARKYADPVEVGACYEADSWDEAEEGSLWAALWPIGTTSR